MKFEVPSLFVRRFGDYIAENLHPDREEDWGIVRTALALQQGYCVGTITRDDHYVRASVQDDEAYHVELHTDVFYLSSCTCRSGSICRHMVAVFFQLYSQQHDTAQWINDWRTQQIDMFGEVPPALDSQDSFPTEVDHDVFLPSIQSNPSMNIKNDSFTNNHTFDGKSDEEKGEFTTAMPSINERKRKGVNKDPYEIWLDLADDLFQSEILTKDSIPPYLINIFGMMALKKLESMNPVNVEYSRLYPIVVNVRFLENVLRWADSSRYSYEEVEDTCERLILSVAQTIKGVLSRLPSPLPFSYDAVLGQLRLIVRELLFFDSVFKKEILAIYWDLWCHLFTSRHLREEEAQFAGEMARKSNPDSAWNVANAYQLFFLGEVNKSLAILNDGDQPLVYVLKFMNHYADNNYWKGISQMTPFFVEHVKENLESLSYTNKHQFIRMVDDLYSEYAEHSNRYDQYEQVLVQMMPYSAKQLSYIYLARSEFRKYLDFLQISDVEYISSDILRTIQKEDPVSLLSYYHRTVRRAIERKNRQSYKEAVRYLKKLRTIYKKVKKEAMWTYYFDGLLQETKRLRAFQEECQRGKLIDVENETA